MKKGIAQIFLSNIVFLLFGVLNNFILPKYLSVDSYAQLKTYMLFVSYAAFFAIGYIEGIFLKYGGKSLQEAKNDQFGSVTRTYVVFQFILNLLILLIGICNHNLIIIFVANGIFTANMNNYFKNFCTAVGEYKSYSITTSFGKIFIFILNAALVFVFNCDSYLFYIAVIILTGVIEIIYYVWSFEKKTPGIFSGRISLDLGKECVSLGIILLLGNSISMLFTGLDQWFVKFMMTNVDFAIYAFAVSMERIIVIFITPITTVLYNYFCKEKEGDHNQFLQEGLLIWGFGILLICFPLALIIKVFIPHYIQAVDLISVLFCGQALNCIINGIYVNKYKANKQQKKFLIQMVVMTLISILLNVLLYFIFKSMFAIAVATLVTKYIWFVWCEFDSKEYRYGLKCNIAIILLIIGFICCSFIKNIWIGAGCYAFIFIAVVMCSMRATIIRFFKEIKFYMMRLKTQ